MNKFRRNERKSLMYLMRYSGISLSDIGKKFGMSRQRVHQIIGSTGNVAIKRKPRPKSAPPRKIPAWKRDRFWSKVEIVHDPDSCWEWQASTQNGGYGQFSINRVPKLAHRIAWRRIFGRIPDGLLVLHKCDNPPCVRPSHLFLGTHQDNTNDMIAKGRENHGHGGGYSALFGEKHPRSKLTWEDVALIRNLYRQGVTTAEIRNRHYSHLSDSCIRSVITERTWPESKRPTNQETQS